MKISIRARSSEVERRPYKAMLLRKPEVRGSSPLGPINSLIKRIFHSLYKEEIERATNFYLKPTLSY